MFTKGNPRESFQMAANSFLASSDKDGRLPPEIEQGNIEYKLKLVDPSPERLQHLVTQLKWRLAEGCGEAFYELGVSDKGTLVGLSKKDLRSSLETMRRMGQALQADHTTIRERTLPNGRIVAEILFRKCLEDDHHFLEIRVAILGSHDSGKSSLIGTLTHQEPDNGKGKARLNILRHTHEIETGRSSSLSYQIIGFDPHGTLVNYGCHMVSTWEQICSKSSKIVTFMDTCGHPKYQRTTLGGLTGSDPHYACLVMSANVGYMPDVSKEHLRISLELNVPVFIVLSKIDIATADQLTRTIQDLLVYLHSPGVNRIPVVIQGKDDLVAAMPMVNQSVIPIFLVSTVTGDHLDLLTAFLNLLPKHNTHPEILDAPALYQIEEIYDVPNIGCVAGGILKHGQIRVPVKSGQFFIGPDRGKFIPVMISSMQRQRCTVRTVRAGQAASLAVKFPTEGTIPVLDEDWQPGPPKDFKLRRGQVIVETDQVPSCYWEFEAEMTLLNHPNKLQTEQGVLHCGSIRQNCRLTVQEPLEPGSRANAVCKLMNEPEYLTVGRTVIFHGTGNIRCVGKITRLLNKHTTHSR
ncbi:P-loop containing nucleoside triphosphate hydrolase protein [Gorgonomyces haynaldii]|nr:P-loop containing nucleoside triphosphate hydrolase protein [Gorgonomyces haynaldii]